MRKSLLTAALLCASGLSAHAVEPEALAEHRWKHRLLLVFAASADDRQVRELRVSLESFVCQTEARDMIIGWILAKGESRLGDRNVSGETMRLLRVGLGIEPGQFAVVLIGKDGGVKARYPQAPQLAALLALIDAMPMRRAEMRAGSNPCSDEVSGRLMPNPEKSQLGVNPIASA